MTGKAAIWFSCCNNKSKAASKLYRCRTGSTTNQNHFSHTTTF